MTYKITGEAPFQILASNFSIGPSNEGYTLQVSADGNDWSDLFTVAANTTRMVTDIANGSYYRLKNNNSEVTVNWRSQCTDGKSSGGGSGSGSQGPMGPQGYQGPAGSGGSGSTSPYAAQFNPSVGELGCNFIEVDGDVNDLDSSSPIGFSIPMADNAGNYLKFDGYDVYIGDYSVEDDGEGNVEYIEGEQKRLANTDDVDDAKKILRWTDEIPEGSEPGDVYATHIDAEEAIIGEDWTDSGEENITYDRDGDGNPQAIAIEVNEYDHLYLKFALL